MALRVRHLLLHLIHRLVDGQGGGARALLWLLYGGVAGVRTSIVCWQWWEWLSGLGQWLWERQRLPVEVETANTRESTTIVHTVMLCATPI